VRRFARVKVPPLLPRFLRLSGGRRFVPLEQVIAAYLGRLFPGMKIVERHVFRVTRDADVEIEVDEADDLLATLESLLRGRKRAPEAVRLEVTTSMPPRLRKLLLRELLLTPSDLYVIDGLLDLGDLWSVTAWEKPVAKRKSGIDTPPAELAAQVTEPTDILATLRERDGLVHHPYDRAGDQADDLPHLGGG